MAQKVNLDITQKLNITCRRGDTFSLDVTLSNDAGERLTLITSGYEFIMHVRTNAFANGSEGLILGTAKGLPSDALDSETYVGAIEPMDVNGNIGADDGVAGSTQGVVSIKIPDVTMRKVPSGRYVYDLQYIITDPNTATVTHTTILTGSFVVNEDVTEFITE